MWLFIHAITKFLCNWRSLQVLAWRWKLKNKILLKINVLGLSLVWSWHCGISPLWLCALLVVVLISARVKPASFHRWRLVFWHALLVQAGTYIIILPLSLIYCGLVMLFSHKETLYRMELILFRLNDRQVKDLFWHGTWGQCIMGKCNHISGLVQDSSNSSALVVGYCSLLQGRQYNECSGCTSASLILVS